MVEWNDQFGLEVGSWSWWLFEEVRVYEEWVEVKVRIGKRGWGSSWRW